MAVVKDITLADLHEALSDDALYDLLCVDSMVSALPRKLVEKLLHFGELRKLYDRGALARLLDPEDFAGGLNSTDLDRFAGALSTEQGNRKAARERGTDVSGLEGLWWTAVIDVLQSQGFTLPALERFRAHRNYSNFRHGLASAEALAADFLSGDPRRAERERVLARTRCVQCLTTWLRQCDQSVNLGSVARSFERITDAVQAAFPGYRTSGLLRMTIAKRAG